ncbi:MAG: hypothetical protein Q8Q12_11380 [bacterium]|nr:hypothetical protein [bacterium]
MKGKNVSRFGALSCVCAACLCLPGADASALVNAWKEESDGWGFVPPAGIAVDSSGNVFVADIVKHSIKKFDSRGKFLLN